MATLKPYREDDKWGFCDNLSNIVIPAQYDEVFKFRGGLARVRVRDKYGFVNKEGKEVIPLKYGNAYDFIRGLAKVWLDGKYGLINKKGIEIVPPKYQDIADFSEGLAVCYLENDEDELPKDEYAKLVWGCIDRKGKEIIPPIYDFVSEFHGGIAQVRLSGRYGLVDTKGRQIIPPQYDKMGFFRDGLCQVQLYPRWGLINKEGKEIVAPKYDQIHDFSEGLARIEIGWKTGYMDQGGEEVVAPKFDSGDDFWKGLARVKIKGKWGLIDKQGNEVISPKYDQIDDFREGLARVRNDNKWGLIDRKGQEIVTLKYDYIDYFCEDLACVKNNGKWGYIDKTGEEVISPKYEDKVLCRFMKGRTFVTLDNRRFYIYKKDGTLITVNGDMFSDANGHDRDLEFIKKFFGDQKQKVGLLFMWEHGLQTALYLSETIDAVQELEDDIKLRLFRAALGHDLLEDTSCTAEQLREQWGAEVLSHIKDLTNFKGDDDVEEYAERLKHIDEAVLIVKLADIYINVANSVRDFEGIDMDWLSTFWLPLLDKYERNLFERQPSKYQITIGKMITDVLEKKAQLLELYSKRLQSMEK